MTSSIATLLDLWITKSIIIVMIMTIVNSSLLHTLLHYAPYTWCVSVTYTSVLSSVRIVFAALVSVGVHLAASQTRAACAGHATSHVRLVPVPARTAA
jgi:hypothetical protein